MADKSVSKDEVGVYEQSLAAATVDKVTITGATDKIEVISDGTAAIFFRLDATDPTVGDKKAYYIPAAPGVREIEHSSSSGAEVRLISAGTPKYSVARD